MRRLALWSILALILQSAGAIVSCADELRPAYLALRETAPSRFSVLWKVPAQGDLRLAIYARLPEACKKGAEPVGGIEAGAYFERWTIVCPRGIQGEQIAVDGLKPTVTDVLVRIEYMGGSTEFVRLGPISPSYKIAGPQTTADVARTYTFLGIEHILTSLDHLLFVLALILLISDHWRLIKTITAFTVAHSITLAGAALGYLSLPQKPVEATIALSIAFLASELIKISPGKKRLSETYPWFVSFSFGLLHGFGFAGALKDIGLPHMDVPLALLTFNLGVEAGQLIFVLAVVTGMTAARQIFVVPPIPARKAAGYLIGTTSVVWLISRLSTF